MPRKYQLYWDKSNKCWFNYMPKPGGGRGKKIYLTSARGKHVDRPKYEQALAKWALITGFDLLDSESRQQYLAQMRAKKKAEVEPHALSSPSSIAGCIQRYIISKQAEHNAGYIKQDRVADISNRASAFKKWLGDIAYDDRNAPTGGVRYLLTEAMFARYHEHLMNRMQTHEISKHTARAAWWVVKDFMAYTAGPKGNRRIPHYAAVDKLRFKRNRTHEALERDEQKRRIIYYTPEELYRLANVGNLTHPFKTWMCLMLNCAWTSVDLSTLRYENLIWETNVLGNRVIVRIDKMRIKSGQTSQWKLWYITSLLLTAHVNKKFGFGQVDKDALIFTDRNGQKINRTYINSKGNIQKVDVVFNTFNRARRRADIPKGKSVKHFRKTIATAMEEITEGKHPLMVSWLLSHKPQSMSRMHYSNPHNLSTDAYYDKCLMDCGELLLVDSLITEEEEILFKHYLRPKE